MGYNRPCVYHGAYVLSAEGKVVVTIKWSLWGILKLFLIFHGKLGLGQTAIREILIVRVYHHEVARQMSDHDVALEAQCKSSAVKDKPGWL